jgi:hypothetical protein
MPLECLIEIPSNFSSDRGFSFFQEAFQKKAYHDPHAFLRGVPCEVGPPMELLSFPFKLIIIIINYLVFYGYPSFKV